MSRTAGFLIGFALLSIAAVVQADPPDKYTKPHNAFTASGMQVRMSLIDPINAEYPELKKIIPTVFQEIAPCRLVTTREEDKYAKTWGGPAFKENEAHEYPSKGVLEEDEFKNPCSNMVPPEAIGVIGRFEVSPGGGDGEIRIAPTWPDAMHASAVFAFSKGESLMFEAGVMLGENGAFGVATVGAGAEVTIDLLGYLVPDPAPGPQKGDRGEKGDAGKTGNDGEIGPQGAKGEKGDAGVQGKQGEKGETGSQGLKGEKGETGSQGLKGEKGETGSQGLKGDKGETGSQGFKGDKGETGSQGLKGDKGETGSQGLRGEKGDTGLQGLKGDRGENGSQGLRGEKGDTGPQGPRGDRGDAGAPGLPGPQGPAGPAGAGLKMAKGNACYPPGGSLTVYNSAVTTKSVIILNYTDENSRGNTLAIISQASGSFFTSGSPNKCFQYVILSIATP